MMTTAEILQTKKNVNAVGWMRFIQNQIYHF